MSRRDSSAGMRNGQPMWGTDITFVGAQYRIDINTRKEHEPLQGPLHAVLTPFLDALVLPGLDTAYLDEMCHCVFRGIHAHPF
jgi:hypothetical protein